MNCRNAKDCRRMPEYGLCHKMRRKILNSEYAASQLLVPKQIEEAYQINNTTTQMLLMRLANEGLVNILPIKERSWPNNASLNEYRVADLTQAQKLLAPRLHSELPGPTTDQFPKKPYCSPFSLEYAFSLVSQEPLAQ